jgi:FkbM family methyltransferase
MWRFRHTLDTLEPVENRVGDPFVLIPKRHCSKADCPSFCDAKFAFETKDRSVDLYHHSAPPFTNWVIENGLLHENFVVVDIGCQGGEHPRWELLGEKVEFYGFDPIAEAIDTLRRNAPPRRKYFELALGDEEGERDLVVSENTFSSSFINDDISGPSGHPEIQCGRRTVTVRRLDGLFADGKIPIADYIKLDCEAFEPYVLRGAREYLTASAPICVTTESNFGISPHFPHSHFQAVNEILTEHRLVVMDINVVRAARPIYTAALLERPWAEPDIFSEVPHLDVGAPGTLDLVYCRDLVAEATNPIGHPLSADANDPIRIDRLIKTMINFELHGLMDRAYEMSLFFRDQLQPRLDVDKASELLLTRAPHARNTADVVNCLSMIAKLRSGALRRHMPSPVKRAATRLRALGSRLGL